MPYASVSPNFKIGNEFFLPHCARLRKVVDTKGITRSLVIYIYILINQHGIEISKTDRQYNSQKKSTDTLLQYTAQKNKD